MNTNQSMVAIAPEDRLVPTNTVLSRLGGIHFTTLWRKMKSKSFPQPWAKIDGRNYWRASDVDQYIEQQHQATVRQRTDDVDSRID